MGNARTGTSNRSPRDGTRVGVVVRAFSGCLGDVLSFYTGALTRDPFHTRGLTVVLLQEPLDDDLHPLRRRPSGPAADSGSTSDLRGLRSQMTHRWGSRYTVAGKTIWTEQLLEEVS